MSLMQNYFKQRRNNMDITTVSPEVGAAVVNLGASLTTLALRGTATVVHGKIESLKNAKDVNAVRTAYNEIVSELLEERDEAVLIAQTYKQELERVAISDEDIEYLQQTVAKVIDIINTFQTAALLGSDHEKKAKAKAAIDAADSLKTLISKDVLKTMQLLGFNYKAAIGEPLTQICANAILGIGKHINTNPQKQRQGR